MRRHRYGKYRFSDYWESWIVIAVYLTYSIAVLLLDLPILYAIISTVFAVVRALVILAPHREQFILCDDAITVLLGKKRNALFLPSDLTIIVSYADIAPPLTFHTLFRTTHILKDKYAISILQKMPLEIALKGLHQNYVQKYTTSSIQHSFDAYLHVYSFVCNQELLQQLVENRNCLLIISESLLDKISIGSIATNTYIDIGY